MRVFPTRRTIRASTVSEPDGLIRHPGTRLTLRQTATDRRFSMPFRPTYPWAGRFIDEAHRHLATCRRRRGMVELGIPGWLLPADAMKLYELVFHGGGDVLELGTYRGLSAAVALEASVRAGLGNTVVSIDLDPEAGPAARAALGGRAGADRLHFFHTTADEALVTLGRAGRRFRLCFVDHSHRYGHVLSACRLLPDVLEPGAFCLFHDYNDPRNADPLDDEYGVFQAVGDGLDPARFAFWGVYGCTGLFRFNG